MEDIEKTKRRNIGESIVDRLNFFFQEDDFEFDEINEIKIKLPKTLSPSRKNIIKKLNNEYTDENLVLVLGAGVSAPFGVPSWNELLQRLMAYTIDKEEKSSDFLAELFNYVFSPNPIISGRYLQRYFENEKISFENTVRSALYSGVSKELDSKLMDEIVNFCVAPGKSPNLNSILTYNFDDILEFKLKKIGIDIPHKSIFGEGMDNNIGELPIYHIHGYLPEKGKLSSNNKITLGENIYHQQYNDIYSWDNIVQINKFRENCCLFIGSSLTDPNIRRLLDISYVQKNRTKNVHYIFKKRKSFDEIKLSMIETLKNNITSENTELATTNIDETINLLTDIYEKFEENDSISLGVQTIWVDNYDEIPNILESIRNIVT